jgi:hypothetical protein
VVKVSDDRITFLPSDQQCVDCGAATATHLTDVGPVCSLHLRERTRANDGAEDAPRCARCGYPDGVSNYVIADQDRRLCYDCSLIEAQEANNLGQRCARCRRPENVIDYTMGGETRQLCRDCADVVWVETHYPGADLRTAKGAACHGCGRPATAWNPGPAGWPRPFCAACLGIKPPAGDAGEDDGKTGRPPSQATQLVQLAEDAGVDLFHTATHDTYATIPVTGHRETWPVKTKPFRHWLSRLFYTRHGKTPGSQAIQDAIGTLEGKALFEGEQRPVPVRVAEHQGAIWLDLGNQAWEAVEITAGGWRVVTSTEVPVRFRRPGGLGALPTPQSGGTLAGLREFVNVNDDDWPLLAGALVASVRPRGPYPVVNLLGGEGTAKTTTAMALRSLVDPSAMPTRSEPKDMRDLAIAAHNSHVIAFDNLSSIPVWLSDGLCRLSTGGGFATRELYENAEEVLFDFQRPVILTGIEELAVRGDLLHRSLLLYLRPIKSYRPEREFWAAYDAAHPRLLGALLDAVSVALRRLDEIPADNLPRLADFARWAAAAELGLGLDDGEFTEAYAANRDSANALAIEASPVAHEVLRLVDAVGDWEGTATELLDILNERVPERTLRTRVWPKDAKGLSNRLRRAQSSLDQAGVEVVFHRDGKRRWVTLVRAVESSSQASSASSPGETAGQGAAAGDAAGDGDDDDDDGSVTADDAASQQTRWSDACDASDDDFPAESNRSAEPEPERMNGGRTYTAAEWAAEGYPGLNADPGDLAPTHRCGKCGRTARPSRLATTTQHYGCGGVWIPIAAEQTQEAPS